LSRCFWHSHGCKSDSFQSLIVISGFRSSSETRRATARTSKPRRMAGRRSDLAMRTEGKRSLKVKVKRFLGRRVAQDRHIGFSRCSGSLPDEGNHADHPKDESSSSTSITISVRWLWCKVDAYPESTQKVLEPEAHMLNIATDIQSLTTFRRCSGDFMKAQEEQASMC